MDETIATHYTPTQPATPLPVGGLSAYAVTDKRNPSRRLIAVQTHPDLPPRLRALTGRTATPVPHALMPLDHGPGPPPAGGHALFVICPELPGPALTADPRPWPEAEIIRCLLVPAAAALDALAERGLTHRAINPSNIFRAGPGEKIVLGPCWAAPPASLQPAAFEPPYSAQCLPAGRGEGSPHDDTYALGVTMLWCALGAANPIVAAWAEEEALLRRKLSAGSLAALVGQARISPMLTDLLRGMLAEDPDHRPSAALLLDPEQARTRRIATRAAPRAQRGLEIDGQLAFTTREAALLLSRSADAGASLLRNGTMGAWLRRMVGDGQIAQRLDEAMARLVNEPPSDTAKAAHAFIARAVAALDPLAPLIWRGQAVFPDGVAAALAHASAHAGLSGQNALIATLEEVLGQDITAAWVFGRLPRPDIVRMQQEVRDCRSWLGTRGMAGGLPRVLYGGNPALACASPLLAGRAVARLTDLLPALDEAAANTDRKRIPIDLHIVAFIAAHADAAVLGDAARLAALHTAADRLTAMALFGRLQQRLNAGSLPSLAAWLLESGMAELGQWRSIATRRSLAHKLAEHAAAGQIAPMAALLRDGSGRAQDEAVAARATQRLAEIEAMLAALQSSGAHRQAAARRTGQEIATGLSLISLLGGALAVALGG